MYQYFYYYIENKLYIVKLSRCNIYKLCGKVSYTNKIYTVNSSDEEAIYKNFKKKYLIEQYIYDKLLLLYNYKICQV